MITADVKVRVDGRMLKSLDDSKRKAYIWGQCQAAAMSAYQDLKKLTGNEIQEIQDLPQSNR